MKSISLTLTQKFGHYFLPLLLICFGLIPFKSWVAGKTTSYSLAVSEVLLMVVFFSLGIILYLNQKRSLNYYSIPCNLDVRAKGKIIKQILKDHKWISTKNHKNLIQAEGNGFRDNLDFRTWSELITIEVNKNEIKINSICDPDGVMPQIFSFGKNKQNRLDFEILFLERMHQNQQGQQPTSG